MILFKLKTMKEKISSNKFQKFENNAFEQLNTVNGGAISTQTTSSATGNPASDQWFLFKKNNPTNTLPGGEPHYHEEGPNAGQYVDGHKYISDYALAPSNGEQLV
jgi:hypothetical protein